MAADPAPLGDQAKGCREPPDGKGAMRRGREVCPQSELPLLPVSALRDPGGWALSPGSVVPPRTQVMLSLGEVPVSLFHIGDVRLSPPPQTGCGLGAGSQSGRQISPAASSHELINMRYTLRGGRCARRDGEGKRF